MMKTITGNNQGKYLFQKRITWIETVILLAIGTLIYLSGLLDVPFHVDETFWMASSVRWDAIITGDLSHEIWAEGYDAYEVRPIPSYAVAISQRAAGISPEQNPLSFSESWQAYKEGADLRPADDILYFSRLPMAILAAVSIALMTVFLARRGSRLAGYLFFIFSFNPYFLMHLRRAMTESILTLLTVLILPSTYRLLQALREKDIARLIAWSAAIGVLGGLAGQSKLTGLGCLLVSLMAAHVVLLREKQEAQALDKKHFALVTLVIPAVSFATFVAVYPFFYTDTFERIFNTLVYRVGTTRAQIENFDWAVVSGGRLGLLFERVFIDLIPVSSRPLAVTLAVLVLGLTMYGVILSIKGLRSNQISSPPARNDNQKSSDLHLIVLLSALILAAPMLLTPLDWHRYYIYPVFFALVFAAIGLEGIVRSFVAKFS